MPSPGPPCPGLPRRPVAWSEPSSASWVRRCGSTAARPASSQLITLALRMRVGGQHPLLETSHPITISSHRPWGWLRADTRSAGRVDVVEEAGAHHHRRVRAFGPDDGENFPGHRRTGRFLATQRRGPAVGRGGDHRPRIPRWRLTKSVTSSTWSRGRSQWITIQEQSAARAHAHRRRPRHSGRSPGRRRSGSPGQRPFGDAIVTGDDQRDQARRQPWCPRYGSRRPEPEPLWLPG